MVFWVALLIAITGSVACDDRDSGGRMEGPLEVQWRHQFNSTDAFGFMPLTVIGDSLVLMTGDASLTALHAHDGVVKWRTPTQNGSDLEGVQFTHDEKAIYAVHDSKILAWNLDDGRKLWSFAPFEEERIFAGTLLGKGPEILYGSGNSGDNGILYALDRNSGALTFKRVYDHTPGAVTYRSGELYIGNAWTPEGAQGQSKGSIMKVDAATGDSLWNFRTPRGGFYRMRPFVEDGVVYAGTDGGENTVFVALDAATGEVIWRNTRARVYAAEMADGKIFVNDGSDLLALDKDDGSILWRARLDAGHGESGLAYLDGYVYHPHGQAMRVVNAETGEIVHIEAPPDGSYFWEVGAGAGTVFAQSSGYLVAYEPYQPE
jgi:outer membrane protein assembly factor BamB